MKKLRILGRIMKRTGAYQILSAFLAVFFLAAFLLWVLEPGIGNFGDALWYCFVAMTTIGFGDIVVVTTLGRAITIVLTIYAIFVIALVPGIVVSYYLELLKRREQEGIDLFLERLCHLPELSKSELEEIAKWARGLKK